MAKYLIHLAHSDMPTSNIAVESFTAGIIPHHIESKKLGNFVIYDFAGHQEYYSSHAAILEQVMQRSTAMFFCLIDLSRTNESNCQSLNYWLGFINNACKAADERSHIAIIGSHADQVTVLAKEKILTMLQTMASRRVRRQEMLDAFLWTVAELKLMLHAVLFLY